LTRRTVRCIGSLLPIFILAAASLFTELTYVAHSEGQVGKSGASFVEIPRASSTGLMVHLKDLAQSTVEPVIVFDTQNRVLAKLQSLFTKGKTMAFPSYRLVGGIELTPNVKALLALFFRRHEGEIYTLLDQQSSRFRHAYFYFHSDYRYAQAHRFTGVARPDRSLFLIDREIDVNRARQSRVVMFQATAQQSILNRNSHSPDNVGVVAQPLRDVSNHLAFVDSTLGQLPGFGLQHRTGLYQLEPDYFLPGGTMAGVGRYLLLEVINPSPSVRIVLDLTTSLKGNGTNTIPSRIRVIGTHDVFMKSEGRGAARLISPPVVPQTIFGQRYVGLDLGVAGSLFPEHRLGVMKLYNLDIPVDGRRLVGFARNISAISDQQYRSLSSVSELKMFPKDLFRGEREFSGMYEDGWISANSHVTLEQRRRNETLVIRGHVPLVSNKAFVTRLTLNVDGKRLGSRDITLGTFDVQVPSLDAGLHDIEMRFSRSQRLPEGDGRLVAMKADFIGFKGETNNGR